MQTAYKMSEICATCLCHDRTLVLLDMDKFGSIFGDTNVDMKIGTVCWECVAIFRKLHKFKLQVLRAQKCLHGYINEVPFTRLTSTSTIVNDICCENIKTSCEDIKTYVNLKSNDDILAVDNIKTENEILTDDNSGDEIENNQNDFDKFMFDIKNIDENSNDDVNVGIKNETSIFKLNKRRKRYSNASDKKKRDDNITDEIVNIHKEYEKYVHNIKSIENNCIDDVNVGIKNETNILKSNKKRKRYSNAPIKKKHDNISDEIVNSHNDYEKYVFDVKSIENDCIDDVNVGIANENRIFKSNRKRKKYSNAPAKKKYDDDNINEEIDNQNDFDKLVIDIKNIDENIDDANVDIKNENSKRRTNASVKKLIIKKGESTVLRKNVRLSKENYTMIYMNEEEFQIKWESDKTSKRYRIKSKFKCEYCFAGFLDQTNYDRHMKAKHSEEAGKYECHICKIRFIKSTNHKEHTASHYRKYLCKCGYTGYELADMALHDDREHGIRRFACRVCSKEFPTRGGLKYHRSTSHVTPVKCDTCGKMFKAKKFLLVHIQIQHSAKPLGQCHVCGAKRRHMAAHMLKHKAKPEAAYCAECDLRFASIPVYKNHLKFASRHRPPETLKYPCTHCDAKFVNSTSMRKHIMVRHLKELCPIKCDRCDKRFEAECRLRVHVLHEHEGVEKPKTKICHICGRGFSTKFMLSNHIRVHTGEKPFRCDVCSSTFSQKSTLTTHMRGVHLKIKARPNRGSSA